MVVGQMILVLCIYGDLKLGVLLVIDVVKLVLVWVNIDIFSYNVDQIIINCYDEEYLIDNINDLDVVFEVKKVINNSIECLIMCVLMVIDSFKGYLYVIVIGGGVLLVVDVICEWMGLCEDCFVVVEELQFVLVCGLKIIG